MITANFSLRLINLFGHITLLKDEIRRRFQEDPSLITEDTHDNDLFSTLFPKERSGRRVGLGLLAGGVGSAHISEALFEVQEVKEENKNFGMW